MPAKAPHALLLVVDAQRGIVTTAQTRKIAGRIKRLLMKTGGVPVAFTQFQNLEGSPYCRFQNWREMMNRNECAIVPCLAPQAKRIFRKRGYSAVTRPLRQYLKDHRVKIVFLCGFDSDCCVTMTAGDLFTLGIRPVVLAHYCASSGGQKYHTAALRVLERLIGENHILRGSVNLETLLAREW